MVLERDNVHFSSDSMMTKITNCNALVCSLDKLLLDGLTHTVTPWALVGA